MNDNGSEFGQLQSDQLERYAPTIEMIVRFQRELAPMDKQARMVAALVTEPVDKPMGTDDTVGINAVVERLMQDEAVRKEEFTKKELEESVIAYTEWAQRVADQPFGESIPPSNADPKLIGLKMFAKYIHHISTDSMYSIQHEVSENQITDLADGFNKYLRKSLQSANDSNYTDKDSLGGSSVYPFPGTEPPEYGEGGRKEGFSTTDGNIGLDAEDKPHLDDPDMEVFNRAIIYYAELACDYFSPKVTAIPLNRTSNN